jgi:ABC-type uncharacterized transport system ATPase subunit
MKPILELQHIVKVYANGVVANQDVSLSVDKGTIHAIVGENGAGKTTLMKILFGLEKAQQGAIRCKGRQVEIRSPQEAIRLGIGMVHQHFMLAPNLTVAENMVLGQESRKGIFLDTREAIRLTEDISAKHGFKVPATTRVKDLPVGVKQRVEILKALFRKADILILDEPTAVLTLQETDDLFHTLRILKSNGITIIFISHKLKEVKAIADIVTVMSHGTVIATRNASEVSEEEIARLMVGREINFNRAAEGTHIGNPVLEVKNLSYVNEERVSVLKKVSFTVRAGEIVGFAGVEGNGQTELVEILAGLKKPSAGTILYHGEDITGMNAQQLRKRHLAHIPEDRMVDGVAEDASIEDNLIVDRFDHKELSSRVLLHYKAVTAYSDDLIHRFEILAPSAKTLVKSLSGGNMQKVVVARELSGNPGLIIADQPSRGVDVGSTEMIHNLLVKARDEGCAILLISADLDEVLKLSTRILVMYGGEIVADFDDVAHRTPEELGPYMLGVQRNEVSS